MNEKKKKKYRVTRNVNQQVRSDIGHGAVVGKVCD